MNIYQHWRKHGYEVVPPTYVHTFIAILAGADTVRQVAKVIDMAETTAAGHLKRLRGWGLIDWDLARAGTIRPIVGQVLLGRGEDTIAVVLASEAGVDFSDDSEVEAESLVEPRITDVRQLRKGDVLTLDGRDYPVKEVRIGMKAKHAAIRLGITDGEWWHKVPLDVPVKGRRTAEAQKRINQATEARDGMYRYGR